MLLYWKTKLILLYILAVSVRLLKKLFFSLHFILAPNSYERKPAIKHFAILHSLHHNISSSTHNMCIVMVFIRSMRAAVLYCILYTLTRRNQTRTSAHKENAKKNLNLLTFLCLRGAAKSNKNTHFSYHNNIKLWKLTHNYRWILFISHPPT